MHTHTYRHIYIQAYCRPATERPAGRQADRYIQTDTGVQTDTDIYTTIHTGIHTDRQRRAGAVSDRQRQAGAGTHTYIHTG